MASGQDRRPACLPRNDWKIGPNCRRGMAGGDFSPALGHQHQVILAVPLEANHTSGRVQPVQVSLVEPVACSSSRSRPETSS